jgi:hypothetical protein
MPRRLAAAVPSWDAPDAASGPLPSHTCHTGEAVRIVRAIGRTIRTANKIQNNRDR